MATEKNYDVTIGGVTKRITVADSETEGEYVVTVDGTSYEATAEEVIDPEPEPPTPDPEPDPDPEPVDGEDNSSDDGSDGSGDNGNSDSDENSES